jgi:hypothetical protein
MWVLAADLALRLKWTVHTLMGWPRGAVPESTLSLILYQEPGPLGRYTCMHRAVKVRSPLMITAV